MQSRSSRKVDSERPCLPLYVLVFAVCMVLLWFVAGCATTEEGGNLGNGKLDAPGGELVTEIAGVVADVGIPVYLRSHPHAVPAVEAVIAGLDTLYGSQVEITPERIKKFTSRLAKEHGLQEGDEAMIGGVLYKAYKVYRARHPDGAITVESEPAKVFLKALRDQLADGVAFYRAFYAPSA